MLRRVLLELPKDRGIIMPRLRLLRKAKSTYPLGSPSQKAIVNSIITRRTKTPFPPIILSPFSEGSNDTSRIQF